MNCDIEAIDKDVKFISHFLMNTLHGHIFGTKHSRKDQVKFVEDSL